MIAGRNVRSTGIVVIKGRSLPVDKNGYLADIDDWNVDVAYYFAEQEGIRMTDHHWEIIRFLQNYYRLYQIAPMIKVIVKELGRRFGTSRSTSQYLYELFPQGPARQACRIAGLPTPIGCV